VDTIETIYHRRAVRDFLTTPVAPETLRVLIEAATQAPSAINLQPWRFSVAHEPETLRRIADASKAFLSTLMQPGSPFLRFRDMLEDPAFAVLYNAPALVVISATSATPRAGEDCAMAAQNLMLAAHARGLGTCCIGLARPWLNQPEGKRVLGIPDECVPIVPVILGVPASASPAPGRHAPNINWLDGRGG
jgi:nitroreductase